MPDLIHQLEALFIGALPTTALFVILVVAYQFLVQGPLSKTLKERRARTTGAVEDAKKAISDAERRTEVYVEQLRLSRADVYKAREARLQQWTAERDQALEATRNEVVSQVTAARTTIEREVAAARVEIETSVDDLASRLLSAVLPAGGAR